MKQLGLSMVLGVALAAGSSLASAGGGGGSPTIKNNSASIGDLTSVVLCAFGFDSYCAQPDGSGSPTIKNN